MCKLLDRRYVTNFLAARADELNRADHCHASRCAKRSTSSEKVSTMHHDVRSYLPTHVITHVTVAKNKQRKESEDNDTTKDSRTFPNYHNNDRVLFHSGPSKKIVGVLLFVATTFVQGDMTNGIQLFYRTTPSNKNQWKCFLSIVGTM